MFKEIIKLISSTETLTDIGDRIPTETKIDVFAEKRSVRQNEFYQAQAVGLKPEIMFVARLADYNDQKELEYNAKAYSIIRTYEKDDEFVEIVCSRKVNR